MLVDVLARENVSNVLGIPDNATAELFRALSDDSDIDVLTVSREGEAFAVASGLWLGGKRPVVLVQNTGLLESGDSLRGTAMRMGVPLVCLVSYRGYAKLPGPDATDVMTRADVDSAAVLTEPTLAAWQVPHSRLRSEEDITRAFTQAGELSQPVAVLITETLC